MKYLLDLVMLNGIKLEYTDLSHLERDGDYHHATRTIRLQEGMARRKKKSTLAHELVHAHFGDVPSMFGPVNAKQERRADELAARFLINFDDYREAEHTRNGHVESMAFDLDVDDDLVIAYQRMLARIGDDVYLRPRMGFGQWDLKAAA